MNESPLFASAYDLLKETLKQSERMPRSRRAVLGRHGRSSRRMSGGRPTGGAGPESKAASPAIHRRSRLPLAARRQAHMSG
jgi:hypothetical protein